MANVSSTALPGGPCAGRPSCARPREHPASRSRLCAASAACDSSYCISARVRPWRMAPAWPVVPPPLTVTLTYRTCVAERSSAPAAGARIICAVLRPKKVYPAASVVDRDAARAFWSDIHVPSKSCGGPFRRKLAFTHSTVYQLQALISRGSAACLHADVFRSACKHAQLLDSICRPAGCAAACP